MAKEIKKTNNGVIIKPQPYYKEVGSVKVMINNNEPFAPEDDEMGSLNFFGDYVGDSKENENCFTLQLRGFKKLTETSKPKGFIVSLSLRDSEVMALADHVKAKRKEYGTFTTHQDSDELGFIKHKLKGEWQDADADYIRMQLESILG